MADINVVAILKDDPQRLSQMRECLTELLPKYQHVYFDNAYSMIDWLNEHLPKVAFISLDHDLPTDSDHGTGRDVADFLAGFDPICPIIVHTSNEFFAPGMMGVLNDAGWPVARVYPHGDHNWVRTGWSEQIQRFKIDGLLF